MPKKDPVLVELSEHASEVMRLLDESDVESNVFFSILRVNLEEIGDTRQQSKVRHLLGDIVAIVFFCLMSGIDEWDEMEDFAREQEEYLSTMLPLPGGIPSHDTMQRVFSIMKPEELQRTLVDTVCDLVMKATSDMAAPIYENEAEGICIRDIVSVNGKETRGSGRAEGRSDEERRNLNQLNVQSTQYGITLSSTRISEKSNEIPEAQRVLRKLDLRGCVVTADALNTQKETARVIRQEARGDYCLALKANQKGAWSDVADYFHDKGILKELKRGKNGDVLRESEEDSRRRITREYMIAVT